MNLECSSQANCLYPWKEGKFCIKVLLLISRILCVETPSCLGSSKSRLRHIQFTLASLMGKRLETHANEWWMKIQLFAEKYIKLMSEEIIWWNKLGWAGPQSRSTIGIFFKTFLLSSFPLFLLSFFPSNLLTVKHRVHRVGVGGLAG